MHKGGDFIINSLFYSEQEKEKIVVGFSKKDFSLHKGVSGLKYYLVVMYLRKHMDTFGEVSFTLNKLLEECGYLTKTHNSSIYSDFRIIIQHELIENGFATSSQDIMKINPSSLYTLYLSGEKLLFFTDDDFVQFNIKEYDLITKSDIGKVNKSILAGVYLYIKQFIVFDLSNNPPKISYPSKQQIKKGIGISSLTTVENAIASLELLKLIYVSRDMFIEDSENKGFYVPTRNVFALDPNELNKDAVIHSLESIYKRPVFKRGTVPGTIKYLEKGEFYDQI